MKYEPAGTTFFLFFFFYAFLNFKITLSGYLEVLFKFKGLIKARIKKKNKNLTLVEQL